MTDNKEMLFDSPSYSLCKVTRGHVDYVQCPIEIIDMQRITHLAFYDPVGSTGCQGGMQQGTKPCFICSSTPGGWGVQYSTSRPIAWEAKTKKLLGQYIVLGPII